MANKYPLIMKNGVVQELQLGDSINDNRIPLWYGNRGVIAGGEDAGGYHNVIQYITITSTSNSTDFGDLLSVCSTAGGCSNGTRGLFASNQFNNYNVIQYITIATVGNSIDFGDLTYLVYRGSACSNGIRGVIFGGYSTNGIQYITISTLGNSQNFGDLTRYYDYNFSLSNGIRGITAGGYDGGYYGSNCIDYITIATTGNSSRFGEMVVERDSRGGGCADETRGILDGGSTIVGKWIEDWNNYPDTGGYWQYTGVYWNSIDYITISTTGNATDFGDMTIAKTATSSSDNGIRGVFIGGLSNGSTNTNVIDYITMQTIGNATDFGDLITKAQYSGALSGN